MFFVFLLPIVTVIPIVLAIHLWLKTASPTRRFLRTLWLQVSSLVIFSAGTWLYFFTGPQWLAMLWAVASALYAAHLLALVTNWRGWGRRLWEAGRKFRLWGPAIPPYRRPQEPWLILTLLIAAPLALISDVVLLVVLLSP